MSDAPTEIEAKFEVGDADRERLARLEVAGDFRVTARTSIEQRDVYYDTEGADLANAGATLRVRRSQKGVFMTFKGKRAEGQATQSHVAERLEDEVPLPADYAQRVSDDRALPDDAGISPLQRARSIVSEQPLRPVAVLENTRTVIDLANEDQQQCELALDMCVATRLSDGRVVSFGEVELEAKAADRSVLTALSNQLQALAPTLKPSHVTKLERALR